jgi:hypothetical protein
MESVRPALKQTLSQAKLINATIDNWQSFHSISFQLSLSSLFCELSAVRPGAGPERPTGLDQFFGAEVPHRGL